MIRPKSQSRRVLDAVRDGAYTSVEVRATTGLPPKHCSAWLHHLWKIRLLKRVGQRRFESHPRACWEYRLARIEPATKRNGCQAKRGAA